MNRFRFLPLIFFTLCANVYTLDETLDTKTEQTENVQNIEEQTDKAIGGEDMPHIPFDLQYVFRESSASPWIALLFNIVPSMGLGSFIQGDTKSGLIGLASEISGAAIMIAGVLWRESLEFDLNAISFGAAQAVTFAGFLMAAGSIFFQMIAPFIYYENLSENYFVAMSPSNAMHKMKTKKIRAAVNLDKNKMSFVVSLVL